MNIDDSLRKKIFLYMSVIKKLLRGVYFLIKEFSKAPFNKSNFNTDWLTNEIFFNRDFVKYKALNVKINL